MDDLEQLRKEIDQIDEKMVELFEKRIEIVLKIGEYKRERNLPVRDENREVKLMEKVKSCLKDKSREQELIKFFNSLLEISKEVQSKLEIR
jgi:monofunctional chorismate mutase